MNRIITSITAATMVLGTLVPSAFAASATKGSAGVNYNNRVIQMGKYDHMVKGVAALDKGHYTEFLPLWYVIQGLQQLGYTATWNGSTKMFDITTPSGVTPNLTGVNAGAANAMQIVLNGTDVQNAPRVVAKDPYTGVMTTYVPIWYLNQALSAAGMQSKYDGTTWKLFATGNQALSALSVTGATIGAGTQASPATQTVGDALNLSTTLTNADGTPVAGTAVTFTVSTNSGNPSVTATSNGNPVNPVSSGTNVTFVAYTNASGIASIALTGGENEDLSISAQAPFQVNGSSLSTGTVYVNYANSGSASISPSAGLTASVGSAVPVTVTLPNVNGIVQANVPVTFNLADGSTPPQAYFTNASGADLGSTTTAYTNASGQAQVMVTSLVSNDTATITTAGSSSPYTTYSGLSTSVTWALSGTVSKINNLQTSLGSLTGSANIGQQVTISGTAVDASGNPVANAQLLLVGTNNSSDGSNAYVNGSTSTDFPIVTVNNQMPVSTSLGDVVTTNANGYFSANVTDSNAVTDSYSLYAVQNGAVAAQVDNGVSYPLNTTVGTSLPSFDGGTALNPSSGISVQWSAGSTLSGIVASASAGLSNSSSTLTGVSAPATASGTVGTTVYFAPQNNAGTNLPSGSYTYTLSASNGGLIDTIDGKSLLNPVSSTNVTVNYQAGTPPTLTVTDPGQNLTTPVTTNFASNEEFSVGVSNKTTGNMTVSAVNGAVKGTATVSVQSGTPTQIASVTPVSGYVNFGQNTTVSFTAEDINGDPVPNTLVEIDLANASNAPLWITAINGTTLQQSESLNGGNSVVSTPIPLFTNSALGYKSVGMQGVVSSSGVGSGTGQTIYAYTDSQGKVTLTLQDGMASYYGLPTGQTYSVGSSGSLQTDSTTHTAGTLQIGYTNSNGLVVQLGTGSSSVVLNNGGQLSY